MSILTAVLALAAQHGLLVHQMDVTTALLNGELEEEIFLRQSPGFEVKGQKTSDNHRGAGTLHWIVNLTVGEHI